jgi:hypothetical protein
MTCKCHLAVVIALAIVVRPGSGWAQPGERAVYVSVLDQGGMPVSGLATGDFIVREGDADREVLRVSAATDPLQIAVLVDTGQAIGPYVSEVRSALKSFSREIQDRHERALFAFGERPILVADYSRDPVRLEDGIARLFERTGGGESVASAIIEVSRGLRQRAATRPVVVLIAADDPELTDRDHHRVLDDLRETSATLHTFFVGKAGAFLGKAGASMALDRRLQRLAVELNNQYLVIYAQSGTALVSHPVAVNVKRSGLTVRTPFAPQKPGATCGMVETNTSRDQAFFGYQCR